MAYVAGFEYDIFLSYSHVDDLKAPSKQMGWIQQFHEHLEIKLAQRFGRIGVVRVWRDSRALASNQIFDATIQDALKKSATFLAITSMGYLESQYCQQELSEFHRKAALEPFGSVIGDRSRIINVLLYNIPHQQWPEPYRGTAGISFHSAKRPDDLGKPYDPTKKPFEERLDDLIKDIHALLQAFKSAAATTIQTGEQKVLQASRPSGPEMNGVPRKAVPQSSSERLPPPKDDGVFRVYVADVADTLRSEQTQIIESLKREGLHVLAGIPPPYEAAAHESRVLEALNGVNASVHLLDRVSGRPIEGMPEWSYPYFQLEHALDREQVKIVWHDRDISGRAYPRGLDRNALRRSERIQTVSIHGLRSSIVADVLSAVQTVVRGRVAAAASRTVLLDFHSRDYEHAVRVHEFLDRHGFITLTGPDADDPRRNMELFEQRLKQAGTMVIPLGGVSESWARQRVNAALQVIAVADCPTKKILVYVVPPRVSPVNTGPALGVKVRWLDLAAAAEGDTDVMSEIVREIEIA